MSKPTSYNDVILLAIKIQRADNNLASLCMKLACQAKDVTEFKSKCKLAEAWAMSEDAGDDRVADVPKRWSQYTSDIAAGMKLELDPKRYASFNAFKEAKIEENKKAKAHKLAEAGGSSVPVLTEVVGDKSVAQALADGDVVQRGATSTMPSYLRELNKLLAPMPEIPRQRLIRGWVAQAQSEIQSAKKENKRQRGSNADARAITS